ncbi:hypothetical protein L7F22_013973 [Adiantum nelumboides]|nr:hypothetical protein [Adiantum nelumboides]
MLCMVLAKNLLDPHHLRRFSTLQTTYHSRNSCTFIEKDAPTNCAFLHQFCRNSRALSDGFRAHATAIEFAFEGSNILGSSLLHLYAYHRAFPEAHYLLCTMQHRDKFTWNHMIKEFGLHGLAYEAFQCFNHMQMEGVLPDLFLYASMLSACAALPSLTKGQQLHSIIAGCVIAMDVVVGTALLNMYVKCGKLTEALKAFETMQKHDTTSWNAMIASYAQHEQVWDALELLERMQAQGGSPDKVTFISIIPAFVDSTVLFYGQEVHDLAIKYGFEADIDLSNSMISMYGKCGSMEDGWALFKSAKEKDTISWTVMIQSILLSGQSTAAFTLFKQMQSEGAGPDTVTYINMLCACANVGNLAQGERFHALVSPSLGQEDVELQNALLNMYSKCGCVETAINFFDDMIERTLVSWNAMLSAYVQQNQNQTAIQLFFHMQTCEHAPDRVTFLTVLSACAQELGAEKSGVLRKGMKIHSLLVCHGLDLDIVLGNTLVLMYGKHGALKNAHCVFDSLLSRNAVSWNICITENIQNKEPAQAFSQMMEEGVIPCDGTIVGLLTACDHSGLLKFGSSHMLVWH